MYYQDAVKKKVGDWVGSRLYDEDGIIVEINQTVGKKELLFTVVFETYGTVVIKHKDLNSRVLCFFKKGVGAYDFEKALYCPSVMKHGLKETSNEDLFKLWGIPNPLSIVKP